MKKILFLILMIMPFLVKANYWQPDPYQYESNMTITGVLCFDDIEQRRGSIEIGAFCNGVCRGSSAVQYVESLDRYYVFMMVYGYYGDSISFRCYDYNMNIELDMIGSSYIGFKSNDIVGSVSDPFVFTFESYKHNIEIDVLPEMTAVVTGAGEYKKYDTCYISVVPNYGYQMDAIIEKGDTITKQLNYSFIVLSDRKFEVCLSEAPIYYNVAVEVSPEMAGFVEGVGQYQENDTCTLYIKTNSGYEFVALKENENILTEDNTYTFIVDSDKKFVAEFSILINYYQISAEINPDGAGSVSGLGAYQENDSCNIEIIPNAGYKFVALMENDTIVTEELSYRFEVVSDRYFDAMFVIKEYQISLSANPEEGGSVSGYGTYKHGQTVYAIAVPNENYTFEKWTDGEGVTVSLTSQYVFEAENDIDLVAHFMSTESVCESEKYELSLYPNPASNYIHVGFEGVSEVIVYDLMGKVMLKTSLQSDDNIIDVSGIPNGTYIIAVDNRYDRIIINR